jgi:hypothetical protein
MKGYANAYKMHIILAQVLLIHFVRPAGWRRCLRPRIAFASWVALEPAALHSNLECNNHTNVVPTPTTPSVVGVNYLSYQ